MNRQTQAAHYQYKDGYLCGTYLSVDSHFEGRLALPDRNQGYDYNHASSGHQFLAIMIAILVIILGGLALGLTLLGIFL